MEQQARFLDLVQANQGAIRKVAALYGNNAADREDLLQEILFQLWRSFSSYRGESAFSTYLYRVALNTALMGLRRSRSRPEIDEARPVDEEAAAETSGRDEDVERLYDAIRRLGPIDRAIVLLVLEERSHAEIADVTGLSTKNVGVRLVRSKEKLRALLGAIEGPARGLTCSTMT